MKTVLHATFIAVAMLLSGAAGAADPVRRVQVELVQGAPLQQFSGKIQGYQTVEYSVALPSGGALSIHLNSANTSLYFNVGLEGAQEALFVGSRDGDRYRVTAAQAGTYKVSVYLMRNAARRKQTASYVLEAAASAQR